MRSHLETYLDTLRDATMRSFFGCARTVDEDVQEHKEWTEKRTGKLLSDTSIADLQHMLSQRGIL